MKKLSPLQAIRLKCLDCSGYQPKEVRFCTVIQCPIFAFRFGTNPNRKGIGGFAAASSIEFAVEPGKTEEKEDSK